MVKALLLCVLARGEQTAQFHDAVRLASPSLIHVYQGAVSSGRAVCISKDGSFLAHQLVSKGGNLRAMGANGLYYPLQQIAQDSTSGLVLLHAFGYPSDSLSPAKLPITAPQPSSPVLIALGNGFDMGQIGVTNKIGIQNANGRLVNLTEIRLANPQPMLAGAPVFTTSGELVGFLNSNLPIRQQPGELKKVTVYVSQRAQVAAQAQGALPQIEQKSIAQNSFSDASTLTSNYGPSELTVAYCSGPEMLQRVVTGFLSPSRKVQHPVIGVYVQDAKGGGAKIIRVSKNSPAQRAGIKPGDSIFKVGQFSVSNQVDYARALLGMRVGENVTVGVLRNGELLTFDVVIGSQD